MPAKGFKTITIKEAVFNKLDVYSKKTGRTIPEVVQHLIFKEEKSLKRTEKKQTAIPQQKS